MKQLLDEMVSIVQKYPKVYKILHIAHHVKNILTDSVMAGLNNISTVGSH